MSNQTTPSGSFTVTLEQAWRNLMTTIGKKNQDDAQQAEIAIRGILRIMGRR